MQVNRVTSYNYANTRTNNSSQTNQSNGQNNVSFQALLDVNLPRALKNAPLSDINRLVNAIKNSASFQRLCQVTDVKLFLEHSHSGSGIHTMNAKFFVGEAARRTGEDVGYLHGVDNFEIWECSDARSLRDAAKSLADRITDQLDDKSIEAVGKIAYRKATSAMYNMRNSEQKATVNNMLNDLKKICNGDYSDNIHYIEG